MGFSNIAKHKYSWTLNIIRCVYLKVNRWYLNKNLSVKKSTLTQSAQGLAISFARAATKNQYIIFTQSPSSSCDEAFTFLIVKEVIT